MITRKKVYGRALTMPAGIGVGTIISMVVMLLGVSVLALLLHRQTMEMEVLGYGIMGTLLMASMLGSAASAGLVKRRVLLVCVIHAVCFYAMLLLINGMVFGGELTGAVVTALLILGGSVSGALLMNGSRGKKKVQVRKMATG